MLDCFARTKRVSQLLTLFLKLAITFLAHICNLYLSFGVNVCVCELIKLQIAVEQRLRNNNELALIFITRLP